ncbi:hypothetical protein UYO06_15660 [Escherichia coli]|nr:hypothetical protein [Escherichia coli]MDY8424142.1 hypothetical protein [Escherichia coli]
MLRNRARRIDYKIMR